MEIIKGKLKVNWSSTRNKESETKMKLIVVCNDLIGLLFLAFFSGTMQSKQTNRLIGEIDTNFVRHLPDQWVTPIIFTKQ